MQLVFENQIVQISVGDSRQFNRAEVKPVEIDDSKSTDIDIKVEQIIKREGEAMIIKDREFPLPKKTDNESIGKEKDWSGK
jgi:hypothetical protein